MYFLRTFLIAHILILFLYVKTVTPLKRVEGKGKLLDTSFISKGIDAFFRSFRKGFVSDRRNFKTVEKSHVNQVIQEKMVELQPYLQDNDENVMEVDDNDVLIGKDETTIIEIHPDNTDQKFLRKQDSLREKLQKYKKVRERIYKKLIKESVSNKTKSLVIKTLDELIEKMISSQCDWKRRSEDMLVKPMDLSFIWKNEWKKVRKSFTNSLLKYKINLVDDPNEDFKKFLDNALKLFNHISDDVEKLPKRYKIKCAVLNKTDADVRKVKNKALRNKEETDSEKENCRNFKVCFDELQDYMAIFYDRLNDTAVSVIINYAEMYSRDVDRESEKEIGSNIPVALKEMSDHAKGNISKIFIDETNKLRLDESKNKEANIKALSSYTKNTLLRVKEYLQNTLSTEIGLNLNLVSAINDDIRVNSEVDLGNLEGELIGKMCNMFQFCNGAYDSRMQNSRRGNEKREENGNKIFVQMQFQVDRNAKDSSAELKDSKRMITPMFKHLKFNVTRTTHVFNVTNITARKIMNQ